MKILLIDPQKLFCDGLRYVLQKLPGGVAQFLETGDWLTGLAYAEQNPDLDMVLLELNARGCGGVDSVAFFRKCYPHIPLVVVSADEDVHVINQVLNRGARGFVGKSASEAMLLEALQVVLAGEKYVPPQVFGDLTISLEYLLTRRQKQVLGCLTEGLSNRAISERLSLGEGTVKAHVAAVYLALNVNSREEAASVALQSGFGSRHYGLPLQARMWKASHANYRH
jgi:DNA-binding NarL/FixJ family response regulator